MKRFSTWSWMLALSLSLTAGVGVVSARSADESAAQKSTQVVRDPEQEKESKHNLEVARHYFKLKKAYRAAIARCEETIAGDPVFSRLDEVLYIAGMSSLRLSENRGKQAPNMTPDKLREDARDYLSRLVNEFPESKFRGEAENELRALGGAKKSSQ